jgi:hypothetical protein
MAIKVSDLLARNTVVQDDTSPVLGGNLNTNNFSIGNGGNPVTISGNAYPITAGTNGQAIVTDGFGTLSFSTFTNSPITLTGDVSGVGATNITTVLSNTGVTATTYGTSGSTGSFTVDAKGRITNASNIPISISATQAGLGSVVNALQVINVGGVPSMAAGSGIPVASVTTGQLYVDTALTNGISLYRYNGSIWIPLTKSITLFAESPSSPTIPSATGANAVALGSGSTAGGVDSLAVGPGSKATLYGQKAFANGRFATNGDAQHGIYVLRCITTDATPTEMFLDGPSAANRLVMPAFSVFTFTITISARRTDANDGAAGYEWKGLAKRDATTGSIVLIGNPSKTLIGEINTQWNTMLTVDTTFGSLKVLNVGEVGKTIRWVATVLTTEVTN